MTTFNIKNLNELAEQSEILKACMDAADRELSSYGEALEAAVTFLVLENKDLRALLARASTANDNLWRLATTGLCVLPDPISPMAPVLPHK